MRSTFRAGIGPLLVLLLVLVAGCGDRSTSGPALDLATLAAPGPYAVGETRVTLVDESRTTQANGSYPGAAQRTLPTRIWYPADAAGEGASPSADGPFPIIGWAHGFTSSNGEGQLVGAHLASHGYVVVAPTFPLSNGGAPGGATIADMTHQPGDLDFAMRQVTQGAAGAAIAAAIDDTRRGIGGLSLGGATVLLAAYHPTWRIADVDAALSLAPASCFFGSGVYGERSLPMLIVTGDADMLVLVDGGPTQALGWATAPITLVTLHGGNHVGFLGIDVGEGRNADTAIGCPAIGRGGSAAVSGIGRLFDLLQEGVGPAAIDGRTCPLSCLEELPQTMRAARQLEITRAAALAHFDAHLRARSDAARWLATSLVREAPEATLASR